MQCDIVILANKNAENCSGRTGVPYDGGITLKSINFFQNTKIHRLRGLNFEEDKKSKLVIKGKNQRFFKIFSKGTDSKGREE